MTKTTPAFLTILILLSAGTLRGQGSGPVLNDFTLPAQVCVGERVNITNLSLGVSTWFWSFCKTSQHTIPGGMNLGNPNNTLSLPYYISLAEDAGEFYSFITNKTDGSI